MKTHCVLFASFLAMAALVHGAEPVSKASEAEIERLVQALSWDSITAKHEALMWVPIPGGKETEALIKIGKPATPRLIQALRDPQRAVAAHLTLIEIWDDWDSRKSSFEMVMVGEDRGSRREAGAIAWTSWKDKSGVYHSVVEEADREKARAYWCGKVPAEYRRNCE